MPTYEYVCRNCGHHIEVVQSFTDDPLQTCERCKGQLRKVFSAAGIIFKGSGYYVTDTRKAATASSGGSSSSEGGDGKASTSDSSSSDSASKSSDTSKPGDTSKPSDTAGNTSSTSESKSA